MKLFTKMLGVLVVCVVGVSGWAVARGDFPEMVRRIPKDANAIMYMDLERLMATPLATKEDWKAKRAADFANRPMALPPSVTKVVRAASINLDVDETAWQIAVLEAKSIPALETIAKKEQGHVDTVAGTKAVWSPRGAYAYKISNNALGLMFPANRQFLARWIKEKPGQSSSYLLDASREMTATGPQLLLALDLEDLVQPERIRDRMNDMNSLKNAKASLDDLAKTLTSIKGVKFAVTVKDKATGKVTVDFASDASVLKDVGKPLLLEVLENRGLALEDMDAWKGTASKASFALEGDLTRSSLMRLSSLIELPSLGLDDSEAEVDASDPKLYATQNHFKSVLALLNDLSEKRKEFTNPGHAAGWWETYAKRVSRLPVTNVDPDMQEYSARISELLRQGATLGRSTAIRESVRKAQDSSSYSQGLYDYNGNRQSAASSRVISAEERGAGAMKAGDIRAQIQKETEEIRRKMTERYKVEF